MRIEIAPAKLANSIKLLKAYTSSAPASPFVDAVRDIIAATALSVPGSTNPNPVVSKFIDYAAESCCPQLLFRFNSAKEREIERACYYEQKGTPSWIDADPAERWEVCRKCFDDYLCHAGGLSFVTTAEKTCIEGHIPDRGEALKAKQKGHNDGN